MERRCRYSWGTIALIALFFFLLAQPSIPFLTLLTDSDQYTQMSRALLTKDFYRAFDGREVPLSLSLRPPLYPLMLVLADHLPGVSLEDGVVVMHLLLALVVLVAAPYILRDVLPPAMTACACGIALYSNKQMIYCHMSEFLSSLCLLGCLFSLIAWFTEPSGKRAAWAALFASCAVLTRLALLPWVTLLVLLPPLAPRNKRALTAVGLVVGCTPLLVWTSFNLYRLGTFSFGAHGGYMYFAAARTLGAIPHDVDDTAEVSALIQQLNREGHDVSQDGWRSENVQRWGGEYYDAYHWNFGLVWGPLRSDTIGREAFGLFIRTVRAHSDKYISFVKGGLYAFLHEYSLLIVGCLLAQLVLLRRVPQYRALACANMVICFGSVVYIASVLSAFLWVHRYFTSVQPALMFSMLSAAAVIVRKFFASHETLQGAST